MHLIDRIHLNRPFLGSRRIRDVLQDVGHRVDRKHVRRLMRKMGIKAIYPRPNTSKKKAGHKIYPYLLGGLAINQPNQGNFSITRGKAGAFHNDIWQRINMLLTDTKSMGQVVPERYIQFSAGLFQTGKRVPTLLASIAAGGATHFSFFHVIANVCFTAIGV